MSKIASRQDLQDKLAVFIILQILPRSDLAHPVILMFQHFKLHPYHAYH